MEKLYASKTFLKMAGGRMHTFHPIPLDPPQVISYRNHQKGLAYFSYLAPLVLFFFTKRPSQNGGLWHNAPPLNTILGENLLSWRLHSYVDCDLQKKEKKVFTLFSISVRLAASTVFSNLALRVKSLPTPDLNTVIDK